MKALFTGKAKYFLFIICPLFSLGQNQAVKLLVDNGQYNESEWCRQLAITNDDKILIVNDFSNGLRLYDVETGDLINMFEGHSLEGISFLMWTTIF